MEGYDKEIRNITIISSITGLVLSMPLIYFGSYWGAAFTIILSRALMGLLSMIIALKKTE